ncbi:MAG TPA: SPASM domain-containing protein, partial [Armatimonadota bacterium]|nr:SPASM domain-containing protein [Armatimonadota bacterium]
GNIKETSLANLVGSAQQQAFGQRKHDELPRYCHECPYLFTCHGECPKNRLLVTPDGEPGLNYLCAGLKAFFQHTEHAMRVMADLLRANRAPSEVMTVLAAEDEQLQSIMAHTQRNSPCPCGSGRKFKYCHGRTKEEVNNPL